MPAAKREGASDISPDRMLLIVIGAHLRAEVHDRPLGYRLSAEVIEWNRGKTAGENGEPSAELLEPVVCTDLWFLNQPELLERPAIAVGAPGVNAATAHFANRLPVSFMIEAVLEVRMDLEARVPAASMWGIDREATAAAVATFIERYMGEFLRVGNGI